MPVAAALAAGRVADAFCLVNAVLHTYNGGSAYVELSDWNNGSTCGDCGRSACTDELYYCEDCGGEYRESCISNCGRCDRTACLNCLEDDGDEGERVCRRCLRTCRRCGRADRADRADAGRLRRQGGSATPAGLPRGCKSMTATARTSGTKPSRRDRPFTSSHNGAMP